MTERVMRREPQQERSRQKVARIVAAARRILEREGPGALNTNRVAKEAGVGVGSVYEYFPDKHAIAAAVLAEVAEGESARILACFEDVAGLPLEDAIREVISVLFHLYCQNHGLYESLWAIAPVGRTVGDRPGEKVVREVVRQWLAPHAEALGLDDLDLAVFTVFHLVESLAMQLAAQRDHWSDEACIEQIVRAVHGYLWG